MLAEFLAEVPDGSRHSRGKAAARAGRRGRPAGGAGSPAGACGRDPGWPQASPARVSRVIGSGAISGPPASRISRAKSRSLVGVELLGLLAVEPAESCSSWCWSLSLRWVCWCKLDQQLADDPVGGLDVVGEWGVEIEGRHTLLTREDRRCDRESSIEHAKWMEFSGGLAAWADRSGGVAGRDVRSMPSRTAAISAGVTSTRPSLASGNRNVPFPASCTTARIRRGPSRGS